jgi:hypothetical protein
MSRFVCWFCARPTGILKLQIRFSKEKNMQKFLLGLCLSTLAFGAGKGKCNSDIPVQWDIRGTYVDGSTQNAIQGDGGGQYTGQVIDVCGGTGDAKLLLTGTSRNATVSFSRMLAQNGDTTPTWASSGQTIGCMNICWLFNARNVLFVPSGKTRADEYEFTTQLAGGGPLNSHIEMLNPNVDAVPPTGLAAANSPYPNSPVVVHHCPADFQATAFCSSGQPEQWFVFPDQNPTQAGTSQTGLPITQVATLVIDSKGHNKLNGGEFSIPFYFVISALQ